MSIYLLPGKGTIRVSDGTITARLIFKYYQTEPNFNDFYSRYKLPKTKGGAYVADLNFVEFKSISTH